MLKVLFPATKDIDSEPEVPLPPAHSPDAVHDVAFVDDQDMRTLSPVDADEISEVIEIVGAGNEPPPPLSPPPPPPPPPPPQDEMKTITKTDLKIFFIYM